METIFEQCYRIREQQLQEGLWDAAKAGIGGLATRAKNAVTSKVNNTVAGINRGLNTFTQNQNAKTQASNDAAAMARQNRVKSRTEVNPPKPAPSADPAPEEPQPAADPASEADPKPEDAATSPAAENDDGQGTPPSQPNENRAKDLAGIFIHDMKAFPNEVNKATVEKAMEIAKVPESIFNRAYRIREKERFLGRIE